MTMSFCSRGSTIAFVSFLLLLFLSPPYTEAQNQKPNIVIIFADDVGQGDVPGYWTPGQVDMPNLQDMIDHGVVFTDAHSTPLCAPSRYVLLSGRYQHRGRSPSGTTNLGDHGAFLSGQKSIANVLHDRGNYHTAAFGKWHLGGKIQPDGQQIRKTEVGYLSTNKHDWKLPFGDGPAELGFDHSYITTGGIQSAPYSFFRDGILETKQSEVRYWDSGGYQIQSNGDISLLQNKGEGDKQWNSAAYNGILFKEMRAFLTDHIDKRKDDPFFIYFALGAVHLPNSPPKFYNDTKVRGKYNTRHQDMLYEMDLVVGSIMAALEKRNLLENTIILFCSDNGGLPQKKSGYGYSTSGPLKGSKGELWEGGHRIPFFLRYDGVFPAGERRDQLIGLNDVYATLLDLANINVPENQELESLSFRKAIFSKEAKGRTSLGGWRVSRGRIHGATIRRGSLKLIMQSDPVRFWLYDMETDLFEKFNLGNKGIYSETMTDMMKQLTAIGPCPRDKWASFLLPKPNGSKVSCKFFKADPKRCNTYRKTAEVNCPFTCAQRFNSKKYEMCTKSNLYPPRAICKDSKEKFWMNGAKRSCNYVKLKKKKRCTTFIAQYMCPDTCKENVNVCS